jgi:hypothetical protein
MFVCEIQEWMGLIMLEWKVFNVTKNSCILMWLKLVREKGTWQIVEYVQLNTMFVVYIHHFAKYNKEKTKVTQLIPL